MSENYLTGIEKITDYESEFRLLEPFISQYSSRIETDEAHIERLREILTTYSFFVWF